MGLQAAVHQGCKALAPPPTKKKKKKKKKNTTLTAVHRPKRMNADPRQIGIAASGVLSAVTYRSE
jgi:hypothetical protein